jgi:antitoxin (DNA-binding transcriptional repressor) of toxin-antitoxin stability system
MSVTIEEAQKSLPELIANLKPGDELIITRDKQPVAQVKAIEASPLPNGPPRSPGSAKGMLTILAEDDEHLADFKEYME